MLRIPGVSGHSVIGGFGGTAHGKLIHIGFPDNHCPRLLQIQYRLRAEGRNEIAQNLGGAGG